MSGSNGTGRKETAEEREAQRQEKIDTTSSRSRERLDHPDCIVIAARVSDTHMLAQMLYPWTGR